MRDQRRNEKVPRGLVKLEAIGSFFKKTYTNLDNFINEQFSITKLAKQIVSAVIVLVAFYTALQILVGLRHRFIVIEPLEVSPTLTAKGYSGKAVANMIRAEIGNIIGDSDFIIQNAKYLKGQVSKSQIWILETWPLSSF